METLRGGELWLALKTYLFAEGSMLPELIFKDATVAAKVIGFLPIVATREDAATVFPDSTAMELIRAPEKED